MKPGGMGAVGRALEALWNTGTLGHWTDGQLLDRFLEGPDAVSAEAFRILVDRHGAMVLAVCRGLLRDVHEAEDAYQATFLVLARKAGSIRNRETIGPWLHGVACLVARHARRRLGQKRRREVPLDDKIIAAKPARFESSDTERAIHEEIERLPSSLRAPIVLCGLEGLSYELAARRLGLREPTLRGRLHRGRARLAARLERRGALSRSNARGVAEKPAVLVPPAASLVQLTVHLATRWSSIGGLVIGAGAGTNIKPIIALSQGAIHAMVFSAIKFSGAAALSVVAVLGTAVVAQQKGAAPITPTVNRGASVQQPQAAEAPPASPVKHPAPRELEEMTRRVQEILDRPANLDFGEVPVPLDDFLKRIKQATTAKGFPGLPIYVSPMGFQGDKKIVGQTRPIVRCGPGTRLGDFLAINLDLWDLSYLVGNGFVMIDTRLGITEKRVERVEKKLDKVLEALEILKARGDKPYRQ